MKRIASLTLLALVAMSLFAGVEAEVGMTAMIDEEMGLRPAVDALVTGDGILVYMGAKGKDSLDIEAAFYLFEEKSLSIGFDLHDTLWDINSGFVDIATILDASHSWNRLALDAALGVQYTAVYRNENELVDFHPSLLYRLSARFRTESLDASVYLDNFTPKARTSSATTMAGFRAAWMIDGETAIGMEWWRSIGAPRFSGGARLYCTVYLDG